MIDVNQSQVMNVNGGISRIAIANPAIADVTVTSGQQLLIVAKGVGSTSLYVWDGGGSRHAERFYGAGADGSRYIPVCFD